MIARNEAAGIQQALASARPWVDDLWVLDTGSTDRTPDLARAAGARVAQAPWPNDFAAARNQALDLARADWHLILDGDEWLAEGGPGLAALRQMPPDFVGQVRVDSAYDGGRAATGPDAPAAIAPSWLPRVLPGRVRYAGRIHEQPVHQLPVRRLPVVLGHAGYLPQALAAKAGRNAALLQQALAECPTDAYLWYQLGKDHDVYARYADALACFGRAWQQLPAGAAPPWLHDLVVRRLHALKCEGRHAQALAEAEAGMAAWADSPDFFFALGDVLLDWASRQPAWADRLLPTLETAWLRCLALGERPDLEGAVAGRGSHLAATNLALLYEVLGQPAEAARMRARAHPANDLATTRPGMAPLPPVSPATGPRPAPLECLP